MKGRHQIYFIADFNVETLARLIANTALPGAETRTSPYGPVVGALAAGAPGPEWAAVVWTRPEAIVESFARAMAYDQTDPQQALEETRAYATAIATFARGARATFVPTWTLPPWHRGYGPLDFRPGVGIAHLLARMNVALADGLRDVSNVFVLDAARWLTALGPRAWSDKLWYAAKSPFTAAAFEQAALDIGAAVAGLDGTARRILILDLDDVLWGGIVGESGWEGLKLGGHDHIGEAFVAFQRALKGLTRRGIQLAIVSKNDESAALEAIDRHPEMQLRRQDFAGWRINWRDKAENVLELLADLGLGVESAVFVDNSAVERGRVASAIPAILVPDWPEDPAKYHAALASLHCFDVPTVTPEDRSRTAMYAAERDRKNQLSVAGSLAEWLASLAVSVTVEPLNDANLDRASQLLNKTNQMNLTTRRLSNSELAEWARGGNRELLTFRVADRFGDSGLTGIVGLRYDGAQAQLVDFILSCRVLGRQVEETLLHVAVVHARAHGALELIADGQPTPRNAACLEFFRRSGFRAVADYRFVWTVADSYELPRGVTLRDQADVAAGDR